MEKAKITFRMAGRTFTLTSDEPPEYVKRVADYVDRSITELRLSGQMTPESAALLTAMNCADEMMKAKDENTRLRCQLNDLRAKMCGEEEET